MASWYAQQSRKASREPRSTTPSTLGQLINGRHPSTMIGRGGSQLRPILPAQSIKYPNDTPPEMSQLSMSQSSQASSAASLQSKKFGTYRGFASNTTHSQGSRSNPSLRSAPTRRSSRILLHQGEPTQESKKSAQQRSAAFQTYSNPGASKFHSFRTGPSSTTRRPSEGNPYVTSAAPYSKSFLSGSTLPRSVSGYSTSGSTQNQISMQPPVVGTQPIAPARKQNFQYTASILRGGQPGRGPPPFYNLPQASRTQPGGTSARSQHMMPPVRRTNYAPSLLGPRSTQSHAGSATARGSATTRSAHSHVGSVATRSTHSNVSGGDHIEKQFVRSTEEEIKKQISANLEGKISPMVEDLETKQNNLYRRIRQSENHCEELLTCINDKSSKLENRASDHVKKLEGEIHSKGEEALADLEQAISVKEGKIVSRLEEKMDEKVAEVQHAGEEVDRKLKQAAKFMELLDRKVHDANESVGASIQQLDGSVVRAQHAYKKLAKAAQTAEASVVAIKDAATKGVATMKGASSSLMSNFKDPVLNLVKKTVQDLLGQALLPATESTPYHKSAARKCVSPAEDVRLKEISNLQRRGSNTDHSKKGSEKTQTSLPKNAANRPSRTSKRKVGTHTIDVTASPKKKRRCDRLPPSPSPTITSCVTPRSTTQSRPKITRGQRGGAAKPRAPYSKKNNFLSANREFRFL